MAAARPAVADAELAAWVDARPARVAAQELMRFLARTEEPRHRELALRALARAGASAPELPRRPAHRPGGVPAGPRVECDARSRRA
jgi:hypothetical protein